MDTLHSRIKTTLVVLIALTAVPLTALLAQTDVSVRTPRAQSIPAQPSGTCQIGVNAFATDTPCVNGYRFMQYSCHDGKSARMGSDTECKTITMWEQTAMQECAGRSSCPKP